MRLGLVLPEGREAEVARAAERHGLFGVLAGAGNPLTAVTAAAYASTATEFARVVVRVTLGLEHPVLVAEEIAVLDNVNNGRTIVLADTGQLDEAAAADEVAVMREALAGRPLQHEGPVWKVPAGLPANAAAPSRFAPGGFVRERTHVSDLSGGRHLCQCAPSRATGGALATAT